METILHNVIHVLLALTLPPLLLSIIARTKALFAGRVGPPLLQPYYDLIKLFQKGSVFSTTTTWVFRAGPVVGLVTAAFAVLLIPLAHASAPISFTGDLILLAYLLGLGRFFTASAALDTGSAFEGMGAAREVTFACLAEPAFFLGLLVLGSVGIALALFGSFFLAYACLKSGLESTLLFDQLLAVAPRLSPQWLHAAFVLLFIGYGTKMGLAPMHTWKPDAYGEAPGIVGTLLAGGITSCAFLAILRVYQIYRAASEAAYAREIMMFIGLLSMAVAAVFMARQRDFKRMLAYSSVEHMGILVLGIGIGGAAIYGALLHLINNGLTKGVLFLSAGNIHRAYGSKLTDDVRGALQRVPLSGALFLAGFLAITGSPPFGPFISEFTIVNAAIGSGQFLAGGLFLLLLGIVFIGMGATVLAVVQGNAPDPKETGGSRDSLGTVGPILLFMALVLLLGLYIPPPLESLLREAAKFLEDPR